MNFSRERFKKLAQYRWLTGIAFAVIFANSVFFPRTAYAFWGLPDTDNLSSLNLIAATHVYDVNNKLISKLFEENRVVI